MCTICVLVDIRRIRPPRTGHRGYKPLYGCWELKLGPVQEQVVFTMEPSPQPLNFEIGFYHVDQTELANPPAPASHMLKF